MNVRQFEDMSCTKSLPTPPLGCALALAKGNLRLSSGPMVRHNCYGIKNSQVKLQFYYRHPTASEYYAINLRIAETDFIELEMAFLDCV